MSKLNFIYATCRELNITGNAETPFLLARVNELTGGASLASSILKFFFQQYVIIMSIIDSVCFNTTFNLNVTISC